jgi:D-glycero-D-manno-heptose 1,7-bisphosphate phosphatase
MEQHKAIFLDRDGTIIEDTGYPSDPHEVRFLSGAPEALAQFQRAGYLLVVVSNQSGIGRGWITENQYQEVQRCLLEKLAQQNVFVAGSYYCPHAPEVNCLCRKPRPQLLRQAACGLHIDLRRSWMIGDKWSDIEAGAAVGCRTIWLRPVSGKIAENASGIRPDYVCADWLSICRTVLM